MIDTGDSTANVVLNGCFFALLLLAFLSLIPWGKMGFQKLAATFVWAWIPMLALALVYESVLPSRFNIRLDLLILLPTYLAVLVTSLFRWWRARSA